MIILDKTNSKLRSFLESHPDFTHRRYFSLISLQEIHTLLGVMILFGVFRVNRETISNLYFADPNLSRPIIKASIPRDRLRVILRFLRFDDASTRLQRVLNDKLAPIREIFDKINESLRNSYFPGKWLTVDDHMAGFREVDVQSNSSFNRNLINMALKCLFWLMLEHITHVILKSILVKLHFIAQNLKRS